MRRLLEEEHHKKRELMEKATKDSNLLLMYEKYDKDRVEKEKNDEEKRKHVQYAQTNDFITENTLTCQSQFQNHRVIKYHWKGMNLNEKDNIFKTIDQQKQENERLEKIKNDEERDYALQTEVN